MESKPWRQWRDLWVGNPAYTARSRSWPIGWVIEHDSRIVGYLGNIPLLYTFQRRQLTVAAARAWVVDARYRSLAPFLTEAFFRQENVDLFLCTTVNGQAAPAFEIFGCSRVPVGQWDRAVFWVTRPVPFAEIVMRSKGIPLAGLLTYPAALGLYTRDLMSARPNPPSIAIRRTMGFDVRFDAFWTELRDRSGPQLIGSRSREALEWHFKSGLADGRSWIATAERGSKLVAYAILCRQDSPRLGLQRMRLVDLQSLEDNDALLYDVIVWALRECRLNRIHMLEYIGASVENLNRLKSLRPFSRTLPSWLYFYKTNDRTLAGELKSPEAWNPSLFDGDSSL